MNDLFGELVQSGLVHRIAVRKIRCHQLGELLARRSYDGSRHQFQETFIGVLLHFFNPAFSDCIYIIDNTFSHDFIHRNMFLPTSSVISIVSNFFKNYMF